MRLKCQPVKMKESETCRLCGRKANQGYRLKGPVRGYSCQDCYQRFYGPLAERTAFHAGDIFTGSFWRPFHIEDGVVMFPALSASVMRKLNDIIRPGILVLLIAAFVLDGSLFPRIQQIPGNFFHILLQTGQLIQQVAGHLLAVLGHLPPVLAHLLDAAAMFLSALLRMAMQLIEWIRGLAAGG